MRPSLQLFASLLPLSLISAAAAPADLNLAGTSWSTQCFARSDGPSGKESLDFTAATMTMAEHFYIEQDCKTATSTHSTTYNYKVGTAAGTAAKPLDLTAVKVTITVHERDTLADFNQLKYCGITDWRLEQTRDVSGKDCDGDGGQATAGANQFDIIGVQDHGTALYLGELSEDKDGSSSSKRPTVLSKTPYRRQ